jgi:TATA-box binding protein (TBP) (component of TFIID and TFIIIB)
MPWKLNKRTTIKILRSGKINIDGANSIEEAYELYHWLENIFVKNYSTILYDPNDINDDIEPYNVLRGVEIYDIDIMDNNDSDTTAENVIN